MTGLSFFFWVKLSFKSYIISRAAQLLEHQHRNRHIAGVKCQVSLNRFSAFTLQLSNWNAGLQHSLNLNNFATQSFICHSLVVPRLTSAYCDITWIVSVCRKCRKLYFEIYCNISFFFLQCRAALIITPPTQFITHIQIRSNFSPWKFEWN